MKDWEYIKITKIPYEIIKEEYMNEFNDLGDDGWELVSVLSVNKEGGETFRIHFFFKRELK